MAGPGADENVNWLLPDDIQGENSIHVNLVFRPLDAELRQWNQTLAAGLVLGVLSVSLQEVDRFVDPAWGQIFERCWIHAYSVLFAARGKKTTGR